MSRPQSADSLGSLVGKRRDLTNRKPSQAERRSAWDEKYGTNCALHYAPHYPAEYPKFAKLVKADDEAI